MEQSPDNIQEEIDQPRVEKLPPAQRETAIVLAADLQTINGNNGLISDINDDQGLAVRQIGLGAFDQTKALAKIKLPKAA